MAVEKPIEKKSPVYLQDLISVKLQGAYRLRSSLLRSALAFCQRE